MGGGSTVKQLQKQKDNLEAEYLKSKRENEEVQKYLSHNLIECFEKIEGDNLIHLSAVFIQYCVYPRLIFSTSDALFSFNFLKMLH